MPRPGASKHAWTASSIPERKVVRMVRFAGIKGRPTSAFASASLSPRPPPSRPLSRSHGYPPPFDSAPRREPYDGVAVRRPSLVLQTRLVVSRYEDPYGIALLDVPDEDIKPALRYRRRLRP